MIRRLGGGLMIRRLGRGLLVGRLGRRWLLVRRQGRRLLVCCLGRRLTTKRSALRYSSVIEASQNHLAASPIEKMTTSRLSMTYWL